MNRKSTTRFATVAGLTLFCFTGLLMTGCGGGKTTDGEEPPGGAVLQTVEYGRLVNIYSYRRIDPTRDDRRDTANRVPTLIAKDVVVRADIESNELFDTTGNARLDANFRFMPFDVEVGHEELLILWDSEIPPEKARYEAALQQATAGLTFVPGSFADQNTSQRPIPVIPRNAAVVLKFDRNLGVNDQFFNANPNAIQVLEFITPANGRRSFRPVPVRILSKGDHIVLDTSLIGGEAAGGRNTDGLPSSRDNKTANIRIALPTTGVVSKVLQFARDPVGELNDVDSRGENAVIRDFRSGNVKDGTVGALADVEKPMIVAHLKMGITKVDLQNRIVTVNKRNLDIAIRGRVPYVDGGIDANTGLAAGPEVIPGRVPLRAGDVLVQEVDGPTGKVRVRAEIVMNLEVGNTFTRENNRIVVDPEFKGFGMNRVSSKSKADGGDEAFARLKVTNVSVLDENGVAVSFKANSFPEGEDCELKTHYYENVPYKVVFAGALTAVSDTSRRNFFLEIDPPPPILDKEGKVNIGGLVDPHAAVAIRFSEPMNLETVEAFENFMLTNHTVTGTTIMAENRPLIEEPKAMALSLLAARLLDESGDGTLLQLRPPMGHFHEKKSEPTAGERYWCHMILEGQAPTDMAGNGIDIYDRRETTPSEQPVRNFSVSYTMDPEADSNLVGYRVLRFVAQDEDGSAPGSFDAFGQFQLRDGVLHALPVVRFSGVADNVILSGITRFDHGECDIAAGGPPPVPTIQNPGATAVLYQCPSETANGMTEPLNQRGSRLQMTYREDDFGLGYVDPNRHLIDVEQMHWAVLNDGAYLFDVFDRMSMRMAHCNKRPDITNWFVPGGQSRDRCVGNGFSARSGLEERFDSNVLTGTTYETVVKDKVYEINPNDAFRATTGTKFHPYPKFQKTYTWRDPRLIKWDTATATATGFGGAQQPAAPSALRDNTSCVSAPYVPDMPTHVGGTDYRPLHANHDFVLDYGDFLGFREKDLSPLALPLLIDFSVYPDGPQNGGSAKGSNMFHIAEVGPCFTGSGYYNQVPPGFLPWPETRAHASGGIDPITGFDIYVDPDTAEVAKPSMITDVLLGTGPKFLFKSPPKDDHVHWAQADFVRRHSMVTFGFFDSRRPNAHGLTALNSPDLNVNWGPGLAAPNGVPDFSKNSLAAGIVDITTIMDPPLSLQPVGTGVVLEIRGAEELNADHNLNKMFDQPTDLTAANNVALVKNRGNLLNPYYACDAYRYALPNQFDTSFDYHPVHTQNWPEGARVTAKGLTPYVTEDRLDSIRLPNTLLPRYLNFRVIMSNNLAANPPLSPSLKSFAIAYRLAEAK